MQLCLRSKSTQNNRLKVIIAHLTLRETPFSLFMVWWKALKQVIYPSYYLKGWAWSMFHILGVYTFRLLEDTFSHEPKFRHENMQRTREQLISGRQVHTLFISKREGNSKRLKPYQYRYKWNGNERARTKKTRSSFQQETSRKSYSILFCISHTFFVVSHRKDRKWPRKCFQAHLF